MRCTIWLTEVAPKIGKTGSRFLEHLANANNDANPELMRLALKLATFLFPDFREKLGKCWT